MPRDEQPTPETIDSPTSRDWAASWARYNAYLVNLQEAAYGKAWDGTTVAKDCSLCGPVHFDKDGHIAPNTRGWANGIPSVFKDTPWCVCRFCVAEEDIDRKLENKLGLDTRRVDPEELVQVMKDVAYRINRGARRAEANRKERMRKQKAKQIAEQQVRLDQLKREAGLS